MDQGSSIFIFFLICFLFQSEFSQHDDVRFGVDYSNGRLDKNDLVGFDLCVLASSDHTIYMLGYFGMWGSLLAGGDVVVSRVTTRQESMM